MSYSETEQRCQFEDIEEENGDMKKKKMMMKKGGMADGMDIKKM